MRFSSNSGSEEPGQVTRNRSPETLRAVVFGDRNLAASEVEIRGDARLGRAFFRLFGRP